MSSYDLNYKLCIFVCISPLGGITVFLIHKLNSGLIRSTAVLVNTKLFKFQFHKIIKNVSIGWFVKFFGSHI